MDTDVFSDKTENTVSKGEIVSELEDSEAIVNLGTLAAKIAYHNFEWRFITLVIYSTLTHIGVEQFLMTYNQSVYLKFGKWLPKHRRHVAQFVVFGQDTEELTDTVEWLIESKYDNTAYFVIVCAKPDKCDEKEMFQTLARWYMVNVAFVKVSENSTDPEVFSYYPVLPGICRNHKPERIKITGCDHDRCFKNLFPDKMGNFYKCPLVISTLEQPPFMYLHNVSDGTLDVSGADGDVLKALTEILNGTLMFTTPADNEWGHFENNNWTGSFGDVFNKRAHASSCAAPLTPQLNGNFQISYTYASLDMVWAARLPNVKSSFERLINPLKPKTRIAVVSMFLIIILTNVFLKTKLWRHIRTELNMGQTKVSLLFYSWLVFLGMPLFRNPTRGGLRTIILSWVWFCYIFRTAYQAALVGSMKTQLYEDYLENFQDVIKNNYPYGGISSLREYYAEDTDVLANWVYVKFSKAYDVLETLMNGTSDFVVALNKEFIIVHLLKFNGTMRVQILPEKIVNSPTVLYFKKFAPHRAPVNRVLSILVESGIVDMLYSRYLDRGDYLFHHEATQFAEPLNMSQVSVSLGILLIGWLFSLLYFVVEVIAKKFEYIDNDETT